MKSKQTYSGTKAIAIVLTASLLSGQVLTGCKSIKNNTNKTQRGAVIGAGAGAVAGGLIGKRKGSTAIGAILGATIGGAAGALIGRYMDKQAEELRRELPDARVERVGEGIKITFGSDILFDVDKYDLKSATKRELDDFAKTLQKYEDTQIVIEGHADATGPDDYNLRLSKQRSNAVARYLQSRGVLGARIDEKGYGEAQPLADNDTEAGRQQNRRVEVAIFANDELKRAAKRGDLGKVE
ncbi:OmpA family protein [Nibrella saemangeumensis]|uniref:OmpA family protein n=1 Tax=Nibrella saemangeumensis TaxID=1084526 RepID=A0ABP8NIQ1_9BACT